MRRAWLWSLAVLCALGASSFAVAAEREAKPAQAAVRLKRAALFKNGLGFFISTAALPDAAGPFVLGTLPVPSHGTFWVSYPKGVALESVVAREAKGTAQVEAISVLELLRANVGRQVALSLTDSDKTVEGTLVACPADRPVVRSDPYTMGRSQGTAPDGRYYGPPALAPGAGASLLLVETKAGVIALAPGAVKSAEFPGAQPVRTIVRETSAVELQVRLGKPAGGKEAVVSYLAKGTTWAPSYMVDISDEKMARLSASAVIVNECQDLKDVDVQLVTGFPNLELADVPSPLAMTQDLATFLRGLSGDRRDAAPQFAYATQALSYMGRGGYGGGEQQPAAVSPAYLAARAGQAKEDLFLYPLGKVTLGKGEVGYYPLFTESVPYKHIYTWEIPDYLDVDDRYSSSEDRERRRAQRGEQVVWHALRLENTTKVPWTTAPAETVQDNQLLGQSALDYTPPKGTGTLRITQAASVKAEEVERETQREMNAIQMWDGTYDKVTVEGTLRVTNFTAAVVPLEITKTLSGEVKATEPEVKVEKSARVLRRVNPTSVLKWTFTLKPGEEKKITYQCSVFVKR